MKKNVFLLLALCLSTLAQAQKDYFQQAVTYQIDATLNDVEHTLNATMRMTYQNNAPQSLDYLYIHLWPNAYSSINTAFAKQKERSGDLSFYFSKEEEKGGIDGLNFEVDGKKANLEIDSLNPDIAILRLPKKLESGQKITITTPFKVKLPYTFSRGGHVGQAYQVTQWFPKPAVYDREGWHPMPYLDQGEFYSEFGSFDVKITLPKNYIVAATGTLETAAENTFLNELATAKNPPLDDFPSSEAATKTLHFTAQNVHDFAWFADKRFAVRKGEANLASGKKVETWAYFLASEAKIWEKATDYISRAVEFYSEKVGEYQYPRAQAVLGALKAGGGMEYPMVTVIAATGNAKSLDNVIMHEVGHNWFYGMLGSNERDHGWMDEGFNTYIENRYMAKYYKDGDINAGFLTNNQSISQFDLIYRVQAGQHLDQACDTHSNSFSSINYYLGSYGKPGKLLHYLEEYLSESLMDKAMHTYFDEWSGKHPTPSDLKASFERTTGKKLDWFFEGLVTTNTKLDYAITDLSTEGLITVKNNAKIAAPFSITAIKNGEVLGTEWYDGFLGKDQVPPKGKINRPADQFVLNYDGTMPELNRSNNQIKTSGLFPTLQPLKIKPLLSWDDPQKSEIFVSPGLAWNNYDKMMLGIALYSTLLPTNLEWSLVPMYGLNSKQIVGTADLAYHIFPDNGGGLYRFTLGADAKRFTGQAAPNGDYMTQYWRVSPFATLEFAKNGNSKLSQTITLRSALINEESPNYDEFYSFKDKSNETRVVNDLRYELKNSRKLNPYSLQAQFTQSADNGKEAFMRVNLSGDFTATYKKNGDGLYLRGFVGFFPYNADAQFGRFAYGFAQNGSTDIMYDQYYFGRTDSRNSIWSQQVGVGGAGFKYSNDMSSRFGTSNALMASLNITAALPFKLPLGIPLKPYFDLGYHQITNPVELNPNGFPSNPEDEVLYQGGLMLDFAKGAFNINFPLINSSNLQKELNSRNEGNYWKSITFTLDVMKLNPRNLLKGALSGL